MKKKLSSLVVLVIAAVLFTLPAAEGTASAVTVTAAPPSGCTSQILGYGSSGGCVSWVQNKIDWYSNNGFFVHKIHLARDGNYGSGTESAVVRFQIRCNAFAPQGLVPDGTVGPKTWKALRSNCALTSPS